MNINRMITNGIKREKIDTIDETVAYLQNKIEFGIDTVDDEQMRKKMDARIQGKLQSGKRLSAKEMRYLKKYNYALYVQAIRVEMKRRSVENKLKYADSKQEVELIQMEAIGTIHKDDPAKKYMIAAVCETVREFKTTGSYQSLPPTIREAKEGQVNELVNSSDEWNEEIKLKTVSVKYEFSVGAYQMAYVEKKSDFARSFSADI